MNRRRILQAGAAASAALAVPGAAQDGAASDGGVDPVPGPARRVMWAAAMMQRPLQERLDAVNASAFTHMSVFPADMKRWRREGLSYEDVGRAVRAAGIGVVALDPYTGWVPGWSMEGVDEVTREFIDVSEAEMFRMANALGAERINAVQSVGDGYELSKYADALGAFAERARAEGHGVACEFMPTSSIPDLATGWALIRAAGPELGMVFDTWHFHRSDPDHALLRTVDPARIVEVQVADGGRKLVGDIYNDLLYHRRVPGEGDFDLVRTMSVLHGMGAIRSYGPETFAQAMYELPASEAVRWNEAGVDRIMREVHRLMPGVDASR